MEGLGINVPTLVAQLINFGILLGLLYLVAYKPIMRMLDERSRRVKESLEQADFVKEQAANAGVEVKKQLADAAKEGQEIVARAVRTGEEAGQQVKQEARQEAESFIGRARLEIRRERDGAIDEVRKEFAGLVMLAAGKVVDRSLDKEAHRQLIDEVLKESDIPEKG